MYRAIQTCGAAPGRKLAFVATLLAVLMAGGMSARAEEPVNTGYFGGIAINGYDTVAYFTEHRPVKGAEEFAYEWLGTPWYFANAKHRDLFISDPEKYAPQYGGYCVGEVAFNGATMNLDPEGWAIIDGKLYLGYTKEFMETDFVPNAKDFLVKAEANWPAVKAKIAQEGFQ